MVIPISRFSSKFSVNISNISHKEYLIEASTDEAKFVFETDEHSLSFVDIKHGPKIVVGKDFFGHGCVDRISILRTDPTLPLLLRVKLVEST